ncbi:MAG: hypothetical protein U0X75_01515 [Acidobacteriota bacterium]
MILPSLSKGRFCLILAVAFGLLLSTRGDVRVAAQSAANVDAKLFQGLGYRSIGPARGRRVTAVAGHRKQPHTRFIWARPAEAFGNPPMPGRVGKTSLMDFSGTASIGAICVAESDANVIYVGTGSAAIHRTM